MDIDFTPYFKEYEALTILTDSIFHQVKKQFPKAIKCKLQCSECCHALFDLTLIEAIYINHKFNDKFKDDKKKRLLEQTNKSDRMVHQLKRKAVKELKAGTSEDEILVGLSTAKVRCALLNDKEKCELYEHRPITCRLYGIPISIAGSSHTCGLSDFVEGEKYPTVNIDQIQNKLYEISAKLEMI